MPSHQIPGPLCATTPRAGERPGACVPGPLGGTTSETVARSRFERVIDEMTALTANGGAHLTLDAAARQAYTRQIALVASDIRQRAEAGRITWQQAAEEAAEARNVVMGVIRGRTTPVGRAIAEHMKREGKTLNELVLLKARKLFGAQVDVAALTAAQRDAVFAEIVASAGRSNPMVTGTMLRMSRAGRGLIVVSLAISVYSIATADDKVDAVKHEGAVTAAGVLGGMAGGAAAGLVCGPGAPVCVTVGAFVGGALAAFGVDAIW